MVFKPCKYGCNTSVEVRKVYNQKTDSDVWRPFEDDGSMHNCPLSPYNQKKKAEVVEKMYTPEELAHPEPAVVEVKEKPGKVPRTSIALVKIIGPQPPEELQRLYNDYVREIRDYGANIHGSTYRGDTIAIFFEIPKIAYQAVAELDKLE